MMAKEIYFKVIDNCEILTPVLGMSHSEQTPDELVVFLELVLEQLKENPDDLPRDLIIRKRWREVVVE